MRLLVCGGRNYVYYDQVKLAIEALESTRFYIDILIQGGATGADAMGKQWAIANGRHYAEVPALWNTFGKRAGFLRNDAMLTLEPDYCIAFPGGNGTANMVGLCKANNVTVWCPYG